MFADFPVYLQGLALIARIWLAALLGSGAFLLVCALVLMRAHQRAHLHPRKRRHPRYGAH